MEDKCLKCGKCCTHIMLKVGNSIPTDKDFLDYSVLHGITFEKINGETYLFIPARCFWLNHQGECMEYKNKPNLCKNFPELDKMTGKPSVWVPKSCYFSTRNKK